MLVRDISVITCTCTLCTLHNVHIEQCTLHMCTLYSLHNNNSIKNLAEFKRNIGIIELLRNIVN